MNELILIVEDEEDVAQLLRYNLQKAGYRTVVASDGEQALRNLRHGDPDLVLLDVMLPEMDGWEVCSILRGSEQAGETPVVIVTAAATEEARLLSLRAGADDFVTKPFSMHALLFRIRKILDARQTVRTLRRRLGHRETTLRGLAHELKNSLSVIGGYATLAAERPEPDFILRIANAALHMERVLNDVTLLAKIEDGADSLVIETVELDPIVNEVMGTFRPEAESRGLSLHVNSPAPAQVSGDRSAVRAVFANLLSNAIRYTRPQGNVRVSIDPSGDGIDLSVTDDGPGVPPEHRDRIFDIFQRCPGSEHVKGAGLGLAVVRSLMTAMGGTVGVAGNASGGSTFTLSFRKASLAAEKASYADNDK